MTPTLRHSLFAVAIAASLSVTLLVFLGIESHGLTAIWVLSVIAFAMAAFDRRASGGRRVHPLGTALLLVSVAACPVLVRVLHMDPTRMHRDEFITAYFSATQDFHHSSFFDFMPEKSQWQAQFPKPFFFLQRVFFRLFGASMLSIRLSVQIYVALLSLMLFLIVREILGQESALVAVGLYSFFAISVYLETLGLMFISSTAIFTLFFYFALRQYRTGGTSEAAMTGITCGFCYLTHYPSYLAFPVLLAFEGLQLLRTQKSRVVRNLGVSLVGILVVLAPFGSWSLSFGSYASRRPNDVSLLTGQLSPYREAIARGASPFPVIRESLITSLKSLVRDGIGGGEGFSFGHLALFDRFSLALLLVGSLSGLALLFRKTELLFVYLVIGAALMAGVVLTIPPPAYHRFSIAFPFLVILMTVPFHSLLHLSRLPKSVPYALTAGLLLLFGCTNERHLAEAVLRDQPAEELRLADLVNQRFPDRPLHVAAYRSFAFQKIFFFQDTSKNRRVESAYHRRLLKRLRRDEKYVYVVIFPDEFRRSFEQADPTGRFFRFSSFYGVFAN